MTIVDLNLTAKKVYEKEFGIEFKGYSAEEVDKFLDLIIQDYQTFEKDLVALRKAIQSLEQKNASLKTYIIELEGKLDNAKDSSQPVSSSDILKRLSRLEEMVDRK